jgi:AcrR family transcriptional regulator
MRPSAPARRVIREKGLSTRAAIIDAAHAVFREQGYYKASVSQITRHCGVSMGTFYQYFRSKELVFQELNDLIISRFMEKADALPLDGLSHERRLRQVVGLMLNHSRDNLAFNRILGESELIGRVTIAHYDAIARFYRNFFRREAQSGQIRPLDPEMLAYALIGMCYFHCLEWKTTEADFSHEQLTDMITDLFNAGINGPAEWKKPVNWDILSLPEPAALADDNQQPLSKGEKTRRAIMKAAEAVLGETGFNRANIFEITRQAGVAQGTFYVHFGSKFDLIESIVKYYNHKMRRELQRVVVRTTDRRDAERIGILSFFEFARKHPKIYRIVPECEVISRDVSIWYYEKIIHGYLKGLAQGIQKGEIRSFPPVFLARCLMGLTHFLALKWIIWSPQPELPKKLASDIILFLLYGGRNPQPGQAGATTFRSVHGS